MDEPVTSLEQLRRELQELRRQRSMFENHPSMSSVARAEAVKRIDADIAAKRAEIADAEAGLG